LAVRHTEVLIDEMRAEEGRPPKAVHDTITEHLSGRAPSGRHQEALRERYLLGKF